MPHLKRTFFLVCSLVIALSGNHVYGQAGLRESLERLDRNENGEIEPDEVTPLARPYLERITKSRRMSIDRPMPIDKLQEAARIHYALQNGVSGERVRPEGESTVKSFGTDRGEPLIPEFGLAEVKFPYTQDDLDFARRTLRSHDQNRDGYIDREEAEDEKWTHRNPFDDDLNKDDRLSRLELAQRYARRRLLEDAADELRRKAWRTGGEIEPSKKEEVRREDSQWWRKGGSSFWLTASLLSRFDANKNGRLEAQETQTLGVPVAIIDINRDGELTRDELHAYTEQLQDEAGDPGDGIPGWFFELDEDRDRQVSMTEFATELTEEKLEEFALLDTNGDGLLTETEVIRSKAMVGGSYSNRNAEVLPPRRTIISEIDVADDFIIGDLNVQLSITHSNTSFLDAYLTGPDGQRIELFTEVGGHDDHFDETIFDDQSQFPITKARPPFKGVFMPEGLLKQQPSLSHFNGKSIKGVWQLVIRGTRSERFGMLHNWSLLVKPIDEVMQQPETPPENDGPQPSDAASTRLPSRPPQQPQPKPTYVSSDRPERPKIDYGAIDRRMREAVRAGKMTEEQVRQAWISIKSKARGKDKGNERRDKEWSDNKGSKPKLSKEEAIERYKRMMDARRQRKEG